MPLASGPRPSRTDPLTRLPNRVGLRGAYGRQGSEPEGSPAVAFLELRVLGEVNARHGCLEGDRLLRWFSDALSRTLPGVTTGRWGGNVFLVLFPNTTARRASLALEQALGDLLAKPFVTVAQTSVQLSVAAGLTDVGAGSRPSLDELVAQAATHQRLVS